jgi:catechol 2,3-dioxygenase-like lactoylglutathione lyase family enzyme
MQLNHLDLAVPDVALTASFFRTAFGFMDIQAKGNGGMAILKGSDGFELVLTRAQRTDQPLYPRTFHVGFLVSSEQDVMDAYLRLTAAGIDLHPPRMVRGRLMFYCHAPGGVLVEVSHRAAV